jgi:hypothetical protein
MNRTEEIENMDSKALDFYPLLLSILQNVYKGSKYERN